MLGILFSFPQQLNIAPLRILKHCLFVVGATGKFILFTQVYDQLTETYAVKNKLKRILKGQAGIPGGQPWRILLNTAARLESRKHDAVFWNVFLISIDIFTILFFRYLEMQNSPNDSWWLWPQSVTSSRTDTSILLEHFDTNYITRSRKKKEMLCKYGERTRQLKKVCWGNSDSRRKSLCFEVKV